MFPSLTRLGAATVLFGTVMAVTGVAGAAEPETGAVPGFEPVEAWEFDLSVGATLTTDYISRGFSQTLNDPAIQGSAEATYGLLYAGVFASNVEFCEPGCASAEVDLSAGIRPEFGDLSFDLGALYYIYTGEPAGEDTDYWELYGAVAYTFQETVTLTGEVWYAWDYLQSGEHATIVAGTLEFALPHDLTLGGTLGHVAFGGGFDTDYAYYNVGLAWNPNAGPVTFNVRYWNTDYSGFDCTIGTKTVCDERIVASMSVDFSLSDLVSNEMPQQ